MLDNLSVVLVGTKSSENVGAAARACANMGCQELVLVAPKSWDEVRARVLATSAGADVLRSLRVEKDLPTALAGYTTAFGTTARTGGWRKGVLTVANAAPLVRDELQQGGRVAIVFGPEDRGLVNEETALCSRLVTIPTASEASSLNLAQAVLVVLYECLKQCLERPFRPAGPTEARLATHQEQETLMTALQETLSDIDFLKHDNPEYWMLPVRRFLGRVRLRRNEFSLLMGVCRQMQWLAGKAKIKE
jgi:tRNA/rRNA methyltransferase